MTLYEMKQELLSGKSIFDFPLRVVYYARGSTEESISSLNVKLKEINVTTYNIPA